MDVLFEENNGGINTGYTKNYIRVNNKGENIFPDEIHDVKIIEAKDTYAVGEIIK
jgi:tRNA A37 methylthiotransferase MiaB